MAVLPNIAHGREAKYAANIFSFMVILPFGLVGSQFTATTTIHGVVGAGRSNIEKSRCGLVAAATRMDAIARSRAKMRRRAEPVIFKQRSWRQVASVKAAY